MVGQIKNLNLIKLLLLSFILVNVLASHSFAGPNRTTYQARIIKPDGYPLEAASVNFKFTILDPIGNCILYSETYSNLNMSSTGGMVSFALGSGVKSYPVSATTFEQVFSNITPNLSCDAGGPPSYSPTANDIRKIVMQFHDGSGWQTLPAMSINAVPYAMYANEASRLNGKSDSDFVQISSLPGTCGASEAIRFNGTSFSCLPVGAAAVAVTSGSVTTALGYTPADSASFTTFASNINSVSSTVFSVSSTVSSLSNAVTSLSNSTTASFAAITSSQWVTSGTTISYNQGSIQVSGGVRISMDSVACATDSAGTLRYNGGLVEYCNGTLWSAFGVAGAGITSINGSTSGSQAFGIGTTGTLFNISSINGVHTFNIPLAATGSVTAGLLSNTDYVTFSNKMNATSAAIVTALGYTPANSATVNGLTILSSTMASDIAAVSASLASTNSNLASVSASVVTANSNINSVSAAVAAANSNISSVSSSVSSLSTSTAASFAALTGNTQATSYTATSGIISPIIYGGTNAANSLRLESTTHSSKGYILMAQGSSGGNVGIGQNMPLAKLYVDSDGFSPNTPAAGSVAVFDNESSDMNITLATAPWRKASINFANSGQPTRGSINYQFDNNPGLDKLSIGVNSASTVVLDAYNRMGIGTSNPTTMLGIQNTSDIGSFNIKAAPSQGSYWMRVVDSNDNQKFLVSPNGSMPALMLGTTNRIQLTSEYGGINEVPGSGAVISTTGNLSLINNGNPGVMTMAGYYNNSAYLSAWEIANVGSGFGNLLLMRSGGNVGVGVAAPNAKLHVGSGTSTAAAIKIVSGTLLASPASGAIEYDGFNFYVTDGTNTRRALASVANPGTFDNASNITSTGNITMTPTGSVIVSSTTASTNSQTGALVVKGGLGVAGNIYSSGTIVTSSNIEGNGIKTKGTTAYLEMHDTDTLYSANPQSALVFRDSGNSQYSFMGPSNGKMIWNSWLPIELDTTGGVDLYVSLSGNVGIGTSAPTTKLTINDSVPTNGRLQFQANGVNTLLIGNDSVTDATLWNFGNGYMRFATSSTERMRIDSFGNIGIGTSAPAASLDVNGQIYIAGSSGMNFHSSSYSVGSGIRELFRVSQNNLSTGGTFSIGATRGSFVHTSTWAWSSSHNGVGTGVLTQLSSNQYSTIHVYLDVKTNGDAIISADWGAAQSYNISINKTIGASLDISNYGSDWTSPNATYSRIRDVTTSFSGFQAYNGSFMGKLGVGITSASASLHLNPIITGGLPATSGTAPSAAMVARFANQGGATLDFGMMANGNQWLQATNVGNQASYYSMLLNPNGGYVGIGTSAPSVELEVSGTVKAQAYLYTSDRRLKEEIITLPDALEKALQLRGVNFVWKNSKEKTVGFIAQEVEEVYPELVKTDKATGYKAVQYGNIVAILVEALKEEHKQRVRSVANVEEKADARMNQLEKENQELKARLERLEKFISEKVK